MFPRHARCGLSRFRCNGQSILLSCYLSRIDRIENFSYSACGHSSQDTSHLILHCPATDSLRRSLFGDFLSLYNLWSRPWGVARLLGAPWPSAMPSSLGKGRVTTTTTGSYITATLQEDKQISSGMRREEKKYLATSNQFYLLGGFFIHWS